MKCKKTDNGNLLFECPGCGCLHAVGIDQKNSVGAQWTWNGSLDAPTFRPSILVRANYTSPTRLDDICHSYVTDGKIQYLQDSTHHLSGQTVDIPDWDEPE